MKPVIICVDDDMAILNGLSVIVEDAFGDACRVEMAQSAQEAIELVDDMLAIKQDIAMVITDYSMPEMNGDQLVSILCTKLPLTTMALMTGYNDADIIARTVNAGRLDRFIAKPWNKDEVIGIISDVLRVYILRKELEKKNAELTLASRMAKIGVVRANYRANLLQLSDEWFSVFGYDRDTFCQDFASYESLFHPDDKAALAKMRKDNLSGNYNDSYCFEMRMKNASDTWCWVQCCMSAVDFDEKGQPVEYLGIAQDVTDQKNREDMLVKAQEKSEILDNLAEQVTFLTRDMKVIWSNRAPEGCDASASSGFVCYRQWYGLNSICDGCVALDAIETGQKTTSEVVREGRIDSMIAIPVKNENNDVIGVIVSQTDITERKQIEMRLAHAQQMESIGSLAAGIAHEINTPIQYIGDNVTFLSKAFSRMKETCDSLVELVKNYGLVNAEVESSINNANSSYDMVPGAIEDAISGVTHVSRIISAMKDFSHPSVENYGRVDLNQIITNAVTISRNEWKYVAVVTTDFEQDQLVIEAVPNSISQVMLNLIINAAHAVEERFGQGNSEEGMIEVSTFENDDLAVVSVTDNGSGIDDSIKARVFDPFFTSKDVGKGTGQGLAIAYDIIVEKHGGSIEFESTPGQGTTFTVKLPLKAVNNVEVKEDVLVSNP